MKTFTITCCENKAFPNISLFLFLFLFPVFAFSQGGGTSKKHSDDWASLYGENDYRIEYRYMICDLKEDGIVKEEVYLRVSNLTADTLRLSWDLELLYGQRCYNCHGENDELKITLELAPNETISGNCGDNNKYHLRLFSRFLNGEADSQLSDFNLRNLKINTL